MRLRPCQSPRCPDTRCSAYAGTIRHLLSRPRPRSPFDLGKAPQDQPAESQHWQRTMAAPYRSPYDNQASAAVGPLLLRIRPHMTGPSFLITGRRGRIQSCTYRVAVLIILPAILTSPAFAGIGTPRHFSGYAESRQMDFARSSAQTPIHVQYAPRTLSQCDYATLAVIGGSRITCCRQCVGKSLFAWR